MYLLSCEVGGCYTKEVSYDTRTLKSTTMYMWYWVNENDDDIIIKYLYEVK